MTKTDNGAGIKQSLLDRAFMDEEILAEVGQNQSPMGLKLTKAIIQQHGGELILHSEPGRGTQVPMKLAIFKDRQLSFKK